ncbi:PHB depolymerase family esterase [Priestia megaterium]
MGKRAKPLPLIVFHGNADSTVNVANADQVVHQWITTNNLAYNGRIDGWIQDSPVKTREEKILFGRDYTTYRYESSKENWLLINILSMEWGMHGQEGIQRVAIQTLKAPMLVESCGTFS